MRLCSLLATGLAILGVVGSGSAQGAPPFDLGRAWIMDSTIFVPFQVTSTMLLREARDRRLVDDRTALLLLEDQGTRLALVTSQMAYHHVAQGEIAGEPWMVSF